VAAGNAVTVRKERPHPCAQLLITAVDGQRITAFATNTARGQLVHLELRHRRRARTEDRIRCAKSTRLMNLPLFGFAHIQLWCARVALAREATAWTAAGNPSGCGSGCFTAAWSAPADGPSGS